MHATYASILTKLYGSAAAVAESFTRHVAPSDYDCIDVVMPAFNDRCFYLGQVRPIPRLTCIDICRSIMH